MLVAVGAAMWGCATAPEPPQDRFYRVALTVPEARLDTPLVRGVLAVERVEAFGIYRDRAIVFTTSAALEVLQQHHYHFWFMPPQRMLREHLAGYLRGRGAAERVSAGELPDRSDVAIHLTVRHFERVLDASGGVSARIGLGVVVQSDNTTLMAREYTREQAAQDASMAASVRAFSAGLEAIYALLLADLSSILAAP